TATQGTLYDVPYVVEDTGDPHLFGRTTQDHTDISVGPRDTKDAYTLVAQGPLNVISPGREGWTRTVENKNEAVAIIEQTQGGTALAEGQRTFQQAMAGQPSPAEPFPSTAFAPAIPGAETARQGFMSPAAPFPPGPEFLPEPQFPGAM